VNFLIPIWFAFFSRIWGGGFLFYVKGSKLPYDILRKVSQFAYGFIAGYYLTRDWKIAIATSILFWLGEKPNWTPLIDEISGKKLEEEHLMPRLAMRGFVYGLGCTLLPVACHFLGYTVYISLIAFSFMAIAFPFTAWFAYRKQKYYHTDDDKHVVMELSRGFVFGVFILAAGLN
jgi:hypothetical protein